VITFEQDTDEDVGKYFAYAQAAAMPLITAHADVQILRASSGSPSNTTSRLPSTTTARRTTVPFSL